MKNTDTSPLFARIAQDLTEGIVDNRFPVGSVLPGELELCSIYNTSRHTIRAALSELQQQGMVSRKKNAGTRVESATPKNDFRSSLGSLEDLVQFGSNHIRVMQSAEQVVAKGDLAKTLGSANNTPWLRVSSLRLDSRAEEPVGWTDAYIDPQYEDIVQLMRTNPDALISTLIERRYGRSVKEIRQVVRAILLPASLASSLRVSPDSPALEIVRQYFDVSGTIFEVTVTVHPADRLAIETRLQRSAV
jgi:GntR family transcriptional regulator